MGQLPNDDDGVWVRRQEGTSRVVQLSWTHIAVFFILCTAVVACCLGGLWLLITAGGTL